MFESKLSLLICCIREKHVSNHSVCRRHIQYTELCVWVCVSPFRGFVFKRVLCRLHMSYIDLCVCMCACFCVFVCACTSFRAFTRISDHANARCICGAATCCYTRTFCAARDRRSGSAPIRTAGPRYTLDENCCCGEALALLFELQADLRSHKCLRCVTVVRNLGNFMSHKCSRRRSSGSQMFGFCYCGGEPGQYHGSQMQSPESQVFPFVILVEVLHCLMSHKRGCDNQVCVEFHMLR